jgi:hypothetical protein
MMYIQEPATYVHPSWCVCLLLYLVLLVQNRINLSLFFPILFINPRVRLPGLRQCVCLIVKTKFLRVRTYVRFLCCMSIITHVILASISVSIALITIKSLTPACQWRNPSSPERGRAGFDSPARRHIKFYKRATLSQSAVGNITALHLNLKTKWLCCRFKMKTSHMQLSCTRFTQWWWTSWNYPVHYFLPIRSPQVMLEDVRACAW